MHWHLENTPKFLACLGPRNAFIAEQPTHVPLVEFDFVRELLLVSTLWIQLCEVLGGAVHPMDGIMPPRQVVKVTYRRPVRMAAVPASKSPRQVSLPDIGERFRVARKKLRLTQVELAKATGIDQTGISRFEGGDRGLETTALLTLFTVAAERGMNIDGYVLRGVGSPIRPETLLVGGSAEFLQELRSLANGIKK